MPLYPPASTGSGLTLLTSGTYNTTASTANFTADNTTDTFTSTAHNLQNGDKVTVSNSGGALPTGLSAATGYFIINKAANTFQLAASPYDTAINISDDGTGTQTWTNVQGSINLTFAAKNQLKIVIYSGVPTATSILRMVFNADGGANYGTKQSSNGGTDSINSTARFVTELGGTVDTAAKMSWIEVLNIASIRKQGTFKGAGVGNATTVAGQTCTGNFAWNNTTDQITSLCVHLSGAAGMATGAIVYVYGMD